MLAKQQQAIVSASDFNSRQQRVCLPLVCQKHRQQHQATQGRGTSASVPHRHHRAKPSDPPRRTPRRTQEEGNKSREKCKLSGASGLSQKRQGSAVPPWERASATATCQVVVKRAIHSSAPPPDPSDSRQTGCPLSAAPQPNDDNDRDPSGSLGRPLAAGQVGCLHERLDVLVQSALKPLFEELHLQVEVTVPHPVPSLLFPRCFPRTLREEFVQFALRHLRWKCVGAWMERWTAMGMSWEVEIEMGWWQRQKWRWEGGHGGGRDGEHCSACTIAPTTQVG